MEAPEQEFNLCAELLDTWGHQCVAESEKGHQCTEVRTVGLKMQIAMPGEEAEYWIMPLCQEHLFNKIETIIFARRIITDEEGNPYYDEEDEDA